jgi:single-stranded DNA-binding protein
VLSKTDLVEIEGRVNKYVWKDDNDRHNATLEIIATRWTLLKKGKESNEYVDYEEEDLDIPEEWDDI